MLFLGPAWDADPRLGTLRGVLLDLFRGQPTRPGYGQLLASFPWVVSVSHSEDRERVHVRTFTVGLTRSGIRTPRVRLEDMGFHLDLALRRHKAADPVVLAEATRTPDQVAEGRRKNVSTDDIGDKYGRVHMERQDFGALRLAPTKAARADRKAKRAKPAEGDA